MSRVLRFKVGDLALCVRGFLTGQGCEVTRVLDGTPREAEGPRGERFRCLADYLIRLQDGTEGMAVDAALTPLGGYEPDADELREALQDWQVARMAHALRWMREHIDRDITRDGEG